MAKRIDYIMKLPDDDYGLSDVVFRGAFRKRLGYEFAYEKEKYAEFLNIIAELKCHSIDVTVFKQRAIQLFQNHKSLISGFNTYIKNFQISIPVDHHHQQQLPHTGKITKAIKNYELPWDVLDIISRKLDFDDLFQFGCVCKMWRDIQKICWRNFMASQEPLLVCNSIVTETYSFISIPHQKVYHSNMLSNFSNFAYHGCSSGYFIMTMINSSFILMNPFTRRKMVIDNSTFKVNFKSFLCRVLLAFAKGSEEFVLLVLNSDSDNLHVYQSRNLCWVTYPKHGRFCIVDFTVLHNIIYVVNDHLEIGVLSLDSKNINFLKLKSTPKFELFRYARLISCDGQLLVLYIMELNVGRPTLNVYKIDFSTMNCVKLEVLGNIALFYAPIKRYYALSNPSMWGYQPNNVYAIDIQFEKCRMYKGDDTKMPEYNVVKIHEGPYPPYPPHRQWYMDWCFRNLHYEIDYSLVK